MGLSFHHHAILVRDLEAAERFYGGLLALNVQRRWSDDEGHPRSIWFDLGDSFLALELAGHQERPDFGHHCFALAIDAEDRQSWLDRLAAADVAVEKQSDFSLYVRDPEGNQIALSHWPEKCHKKG